MKGLLPAEAVPGAVGSTASRLDSFAIATRDMERHYTVYSPAADHVQHLPVVLMLHGGGGTSKTAMEETGWMQKAEAAGFLLVFPEGARQHTDKPPGFRTNPQTWNDGSGRFYSGKQNIDDVAFIDNVIEEVALSHDVDAGRVFVTGFSNGASMAYRLALELSERIAAIAPVASSGLRMPAKKRKSPVPVVAIQGMGDPRNPLEGGTVRLADGQEDTRSPVTETIERWAAMNGCDPTPTVSDVDGVKRVSYGGRNEAEVVLYLVSGMGHTWPGGKTLLPKSLVGDTTSRLNANDVIWAFFDAHPKSHQAPSTGRKAVN